MPTEQKQDQIVFTNKARCRDCYRCVRVCPVKAIGLHAGQAAVDPHRCIACGTCVRECPQGAKSTRNDVVRAKRLLSDGGCVAASVAPSFASVFADWQRKRLPSALRKLGFSHVAETAIGAYDVAARTAEAAEAQAGRPTVCTACPAVVNFVEKYQADWAAMLAPVVSPMIAHARHIKRRMGQDARVVFIGPCVAKKAEAERPEHAGVVDCVLTFDELLGWLEGEQISLRSCEESNFDERPRGDSRYFPVEGGLIRTARLSDSILDRQTMCVSGFEEVRQALQDAAEAPTGVIIEPLFCPQGCVNGPAIPGDRNLFRRRTDVLNYAADHPGAGHAAIERPDELGAVFAPRTDSLQTTVSEDQVREVLARTGKTRPEDQLNCGACGYPSCREKAVAVIRGLAEPEMCIPYMKRLAERRTDRIIETSPNGIIVLDDRLNIISMNPAFRRYFSCSEAVCGKSISYLMDPEPFERLATGTADLVDITVRHANYDLVCHEILYALREEKQYIGIFVNVTRSSSTQEKLSRLQAQTVAQAKELQEHQVAMAQKIAQMLGEYTAQGETLVDNLLRLAGSEQAEASDKTKGSWPWDTRTSR